MKETRQVWRGNAGSTDVLNNVYDLLGNNEEWTLEAQYTEHRIARGGSRSSLGKVSSGHRDFLIRAMDTNVSMGSRATLYLKY